MERAMRDAAAILALMLCSQGCAFLDSASELTVGPDEIPRFRVETSFPRVEELGEFSMEEMNEIEGFPDSLDEATLAHLQGALTLNGECRRVLVTEQRGTDDRVSGERIYSLTTCSRTERCAQHCPTGLRGMVFESSTELQLIDAKKAEEIRDMLSEANPDSIVQIRLRFFELGLVQERHGQVQDAGELLSAFQLSLRSEQGNELVVVPDGYLQSISPETPQRFDLDSESLFMEELKSSILGGVPIRFTLMIRMEILQQDLYELEIGRAGFRLDMQPEVVISVLEAVRASL